MKRLGWFVLCAVLTGSQAAALSERAPHLFRLGNLAAQECSLLLFRWPQAGSTLY